MKAQDLTIEINASLTISDETAERCMRLLEMWMDDNPNRTILCSCIGNRHKLRFAAPGMGSQNDETTHKQG